MEKLCLCCNDEATTYHIYECKDTNDGCHFTSEKNAKCNHIERLKPSCISTCKDESTMRIEIAKLANQGKEICGLCVSTLYRNS